MKALLRSIALHVDWIARCRGMPRNSYVGQMLAAWKANKPDDSET